MNSYIWYASPRGLSQNTIVSSLAISTLCLLGYVSSTLSASTMPEYCFAFFGHIDTLPLELFASWATLSLGLLLPLGLLCLLGCFASWASYRHFASQAMSHRHCLLWQCWYTNMPLGLFQHVATWAMSHRHCLLWQCRYTDMPLGLCHHWALVSMQKW
jgi:hypothetical protein